MNRERTAMSWQAWRDDRVTQAAVAWVLTTVFVRFCEDNRLLKPVWIAGPADRRQEALDAELAYFRAHPEHTDREWLLQAVEYLRATKATRDLVESHSPLWTVSPSGQAAKRLIAFWRERTADGALVWDLTDPTLSTRFLGDLYQDLSDYAKKTFALLQTPEFVEEFILDQTLEPALQGAAAGGLPADRPDLRLGALPARSVRPAQRPLGRAGPGPGVAGAGAEGPRRDPRRRPQPVRGGDRPVPAPGRGAAGAAAMTLAGGRAGLHVPPRRRGLAAARRHAAGARPGRRRRDAGLSGFAYATEDLRRAPVDPRRRQLRRRGRQPAVHHRQGQEAQRGLPRPATRPATASTR